MNGVDARVRSALFWMLLFAGIAALVGWETDWGHALRPALVADSTVAPQPVSVALLPEYRIDGGLESLRETVERTLFNPTRRPAPPQAAASSKPAMQAGQFVLTGTTVIDKKATALLREVNGGRSRRVQQGETINGMLVAEVRSDRVRLTSGDATEELTLKVASGPKTTVQPPVAAAPQPAQPAPGAPPVPPQAAQAPQAATPQQPNTVDVGETLANRRRAARAAEAAAQQNAQPPQPVPTPPPTQAAPANPSSAADPAWSDVYQRYIQRQK